MPGNEKERMIVRTALALAVGVGAFFAVCSVGAMLMLGGRLTLDAAKVVMVTALLCGTLGAAAVWRLGRPPRTKRRK